MSANPTLARALSPVDGRYAAATEPLRALLLRGRTDPRTHPRRGAVAAAARRSRATAARRAAAAARAARLRALAAAPARPQAAAAVKAIEARIKHDVKAVEYFVRERARRRRRRPGDARAGALRLHLGRHQQSQLCAPAASRRARRCCCRNSRRSAARCAGLAHSYARPADARAHARPDGEPDDARQGIRQRRGAPASARGRGWQAVRSSASGTARSATTTRTRPPSRSSTGARRRALRRLAAAGVESLHDADRAARLDR